VLQAGLLDCKCLIINAMCFIQEYWSQFGRQFRCCHNIADLLCAKASAVVGTEQAVYCVHDCIRIVRVSALKSRMCVGPV